jgi:hypothetical protein
VRAPAARELLRFSVATVIDVGQSRRRSVRGIAAAPALAKGTAAGHAVPCPRSQPVAMRQQSEERDGAQGQKGKREDAALIGKARCECREALARPGPAGMSPSADHPRSTGLRETNQNPRTRSRAVLRRPLERGTVLLTAIRQLSASLSRDIRSTVTHRDYRPTRVIVSSVSWVATVEPPLTKRPGGTRTKPSTNAPRFRRTEPDVPRHQSCSEVR